MAAYAALVSLLNNMEQIRNHPRLSTSFDEKQMESLLQKVDFLLDFIQSCNSSGCSNDQAEDLERQIASASHAAEDAIESHILDQILAGNTEEGSSFLDLGKIIEDMGSLKENVMNVKKEKGYKVELPDSPRLAASSRSVTAGKSDMVGFDGYLTQLLDELTGYQSDRRVIPIIGMGGIGKTTLARNAYDNLLVEQHFDVRAWVTVSQRYNVREILLQILSCLRKSNNELDEKNELGERIHKTLSGMRYLIIIDDMWSIEAWDQIKFFFPNNCNRSRIIVTTRIFEVADHFSSMGFALNFLDDDDSWKLFCEKVFPGEVCPPELEESGMKIVKRCRGLPLAIVVIGGLLGNSSRTQDQWENVEKDMRSILNTVEDNRCSKLLSLSYTHLPARLKPCFLYLGIFPEDDIIRVSRLIKLWVAEGFIKPNKDQCLEEIAEGYLEDLVDRNLVSVHSLRWNGKLKTCSIHDLVRDLCIRIADKEKFHCVTGVLDKPQEIDRQRRIIIHGSIAEMDYYPRVFDTLKSTSLARSLISSHCRVLHVKSRLLRVLVEVYSEPIDIIFQQVNLRFFVQESLLFLISPISFYHLPSSISLLWNVQTLTMTEMVRKAVALSQIWEMPQLRHLKFKFISLPDPPPTDGFVLHNLQTLGRVLDFRFSEEACKRMPNVKKLHVYNGYFSRDGDNFVFFNKLESLHYKSDHQLGRDDLLRSIKFPNSLKKLTLESFRLQWKDLTVIASLPHLEALKLKDSISGFIWDPVEGEFLRLKYLGIDYSDLNCWNADSTHFPVLENLDLDELYNLYEIPSGIGEIQTLRRICLIDCSVPAALSAVKILEEQESFGNQGLQVIVGFPYEPDLKKFMKQVELEGLIDINFHIVSF